MQTTIEFLLDRLELINKDHKLGIEELSNIVIITCSCGTFHTLRSLENRLEGEVAHYRHSEQMQFEKHVATTALESVKHMIV